MDQVPSHNRSLSETTASEPAKDEQPMGSVDRAVIEALERDDRVGALQILMREYGLSLYRYCFSRLHDSAAAADVHQIAFIQAYESFADFSRTSPVRRWLFGIAHHRCLDAAREIRRRAARISSGDQMPDHADPRPPCDDEIAALELGAMVTECIDKLKEDARTAVRLRYQGGFTYEKIASILGENPPALQQRVSRAIQALRRCLERTGAQL